MMQAGQQVNFQLSLMTEVHARIKGIMTVIHQSLGASTVKKVKCLQCRNDRILTPFTKFLQNKIWMIFEERDHLDSVSARRVQGILCIISTDMRGSISKIQLLGQLVQFVLIILLIQVSES